MPFKDAAHRQVKAKEYTAAYRARLNAARNAVALARFCALCSADLTGKRSDAKFCSREHKKVFADRNRDHAANYQKHKNTRREQATAYYHKNIDENRAKARVRQRLNPSLYAAHTAKRRAAILKRTPLWLSNDHLQAIRGVYALAAKKTVETGVKWHVDHIIPLQGRSVSGLHVPWNLQVLPAAKNIAKHNRYEAP